ncbi:ABC transporter ATP-binding protein [Rheinheimera pleomorphica]|uniref:ABC transporter ATP-binding protein n=1 Tax=Rheinheimera pleomorphica TaxID=2703963 RepID=UPI001F5098D0|nr:ABC transporter ATP-binding protein [Rheinheimera pleomorphica]
MTAMIELHQLCRSFLLGDQAVKALDNINLSIRAGEYISVMGPSGSGKSTLLNMLGLLDAPDSGQYLLQGTDTTLLTDNERARFRRQHIGFVFQSYHLVPRLTAQENIELPLVLAGVPPQQRKPKVAAILAQLSLTERASHLPNQLSGGQRQRVAIGRAIVMQPQLLLADEPTGNLDSQSGLDVVNILEQLNQQGITLLVVTHDPALGQRARRRIRMVDGRIVADEQHSTAAGTLHA